MINNNLLKDILNDIDINKDKLNTDNDLVIVLDNIIGNIKKYNIIEIGSYKGISSLIFYTYFNKIYSFDYIDYLEKYIYLKKYTKYIESYYNKAYIENNLNIFFNTVSKRKDINNIIVSSKEIFNYGYINYSSDIRRDFNLLNRLGVSNILINNIKIKKIYNFLIEINGEIITDNIGLFRKL